MARSLTLFSVFGRGLKQPPVLGVAQRRRAAFVALRRGALDGIDGITRHCVALTEILERSRQRGELAAMLAGDNSGLSCPCAKR